MSIRMCRSMSLRSTANSTPTSTSGRDSATLATGCSVRCSDREGSETDRAPSVPGRGLFHDLTQQFHIGIAEALSQKEVDPGFFERVAKAEDEDQFALVEIVVIL